MQIIIELSTYSVFIPGIIGMFRWKVMDRSFRPFIVLIWFGCFFEVLMAIMIELGYYTVSVANVYFLIEALLILWFLYKQGLFERHPAWMPVLAFVLCSAWAFETLIWKDITDYAAYFRLATSFMIVLMSITALNRFLLHFTTSISKESRFFIYTGFILYFTLSVLINAFLLKGVDMSKFVLNVQVIHLVVNIITNVFYCIAALHIPKQPFFNQMKPLSLKYRA
jgi:hypothetical protein